MALSDVARPIETLQQPDPGTWKLDLAHSSVGFSARHLMVSRVRGEFRDFSGVIRVGQGPEESGVEVTIQAASIETHDAKRDQHLRSPDFLDVERHPTLAFRSTGALRTGETTLEIAGELTVRDVTRPVVLRAEYLGLVRDPWGNDKIAFTATTEIDREEFGLTWNQPLETGGVLVGKRVRVELEVQAGREQ